MSSSIPEFQGVAAVIPARYGSSRYPGKPLVPILGIPLVVRVYDRVASALPPKQIYVATEDERIRKECLNRGIQVVMTSEKCLTGTDRVYEAAAQIPEETIVNVQGDEPLIVASDILTVVRAKRETPEFVVNAMCSIIDREDIDSPNVPKVVVNEDNRLVYMSRAPIPFPKAKGVAANYRRQVCIYAFNRRELKAFYDFGRKSRLEAPEDIEILRFFDLGIPIRMVEVSGSSVAVDVPEDVARVERLL